MTPAPSLRLQLDQKHTRQSVDEPTRGDILAAIAKLDGSRFTDVALERRVNGRIEASLIIAGGREDLVLIVLFKGDDSWFECREPTASGGVVTMVVGGQEAEYERSVCVSKESARIAVEDFLAAGVPSPALWWVENHALQEPGFTQRTQAACPGYRGDLTLTVANRQA